MTKNQNDMHIIVPAKLTKRDNQVRFFYIMPCVMRRRTWRGSLAKMGHVYISCEKDNSLNRLLGVMRKQYLLISTLTFHQTILYTTTRGGFCPYNQIVFCVICHMFACAHDIPSIPAGGRAYTIDQSQYHAHMHQPGPLIPPSRVLAYSHKKTFRSPYAYCPSTSRHGKGEVQFMCSCKWICTTKTPKKFFLFSMYVYTQ